MHTRLESQHESHRHQRRQHGFKFVNNCHAGHQVKSPRAAAARRHKSPPQSRARRRCGELGSRRRCRRARRRLADAPQLKSVGDPQGKVVNDITNPLTADYMGLTLGHSTSAAEEIAQAVPGAEVVKGFNTLFAQVLADGADFGNGQKASVFVASDSAHAKQVATTLAESMGFTVIDAGGLKNARYLEPLAGLNIYLGYGAGLGTAIAPTWIRKA
jgi:hypothetical protein